MSQTHNIGISFFEFQSRNIKVKEFKNNHINTLKSAISVRSWVSKEVAQSYMWGCDSICEVGMEPICCSGVKNKWDSLKIALKMLYPLSSFKLRGGKLCTPLFQNNGCR